MSRHGNPVLWQSNCWASLYVALFFMMFRIGRNLCRMCVINKLVKDVLLQSIETYNTFDGMFWYKKDLFFLKCVVDNYRSNGRYSCSLDLAKAFDKVNHKTITQGWILLVFYLTFNVLCGQSIYKRGRRNYYVCPMPHRVQEAIIYTRKTFVCFFV